ncbi:MAG: AraC family transcriptional regulator [Lachnospiraceae bacterium]
MEHRKNHLVNSMVSGNYEVFHINEIVEEHKTLYHLHDFYEIHITLNGNGIFYLDGSLYELSAGSILLIHHGDLHRIVAQKSSQYERVYMFVTPEFLEHASTENTNLLKCFTPTGSIRSKVLKADMKEVGPYIEPFMCSIDKKNYGQDLIYEQAVVRFILFLNQLALREENDVLNENDSSNELIDTVMKYVNDHLKEDLSLERVSSHFFISKYYLSHKFKEITDMTFHNFVLKKRLYYAKQLLRKYHNASVVYNDCGFASYTYFLKSFKKEFSITPKQFVMLAKQGEKMRP